MNHVFGLEWWQFCLYVFLAGLCWCLGCWVCARLTGITIRKKD